ncbi:MAG: L-lysine 6-transaminase [Ignavibacteria bacterium]|nr:L-lysine 6-transaminase [Ignavibacteria bacterium]
MSTNKTKNGGVFVNPESVQDTLKKYMLVDGFDITLDLKNSKGAYIYDSKHKKNLLDFFTFVSSNPIGMNHPKLYNEEFIRKIGEVAVSKPSLSDIYTTEQAEFVDTFFKTAIPSYFKYIFFIEGGTLAVENTLKAAFDWKVRKNFQKGYKDEKGTKIIHFREAFHGRSGYCLSLTNTDVNKIKYFPKFDWPRISNPKVKFPIEGENLEYVIKAEEQAVNEIKDAINKNKDDIAGLIIEVIQGEGGDNHFRKEFFVKLRELCDENEILLVFDEVQTGIGITGKWWAHEYFVKPDLLAFGKKTQVCGVLSTNRIDEIEENVFRTTTRINSTWGGNIVDMFRFKRILEIIKEDNLVSNAETRGKYLLNRIYELQNKYPGKISNGRGIGLFCAFDCATTELRNKIMTECHKNSLLILGCGENSIRFRPSLAITEDEINEGFEILDKVISAL